MPTMGAARDGEDSDAAAQLALSPLHLPSLQLCHPPRPGRQALSASSHTHTKTHKHTHTHTRGGYTAAHSAEVVQAPSTSTSSSSWWWCSCSSSVRCSAPGARVTWVHPRKNNYLKVKTNAPVVGSSASGRQSACGGRTSISTRWLLGLVCRPISGQLAWQKKPINHRAGIAQLREGGGSGVARKVERWSSLISIFCTTASRVAPTKQGRLTCSSPIISSHHNMPSIYSG
jgi:hypothetical protein